MLIIRITLQTNVKAADFILYERVNFYADKER